MTPYRSLVQHAGQSRLSRPATALLAALVAAGLASPAGAATINWVGDTSSDFMNGANWATDPALPSLSADTWQVNAVGTQGNPTLNVSSPLTFTGTGGKIAFGDSYPTGGLSGSTLTFFNGTGDAIGVGVNNVDTITIANNLVLGNGAASTISLTARNTATGLLRTTGTISGGTGGTAGALVLSLGSTGTHNGNYELAGNITRGGAASIQLTKRGTGTATLTGTNVFVNLGSNEAGSTIRINGGQTNILNAATGGFGVANQGTSVIRVSAGELNSFDSRNVRNSIAVDGGTWNLGQAYNESAVLQSNTTGGARLSFNSGSGTAYTFSLSSGNVNFLPSYATNNFGVRFGNDSGPGNVGTTATEATVAATQTGGTFIVNGAGGQDQTFQLGTGTGGKTNSYTLSGGTLDIRGSNSTNAHLTIGASADGSGTSTFVLSGTGKLIVRSTAAGGQGINGRNTGGVQNFDFNGGTLVAGEITTALLRRTGDTANGVFTQAGGVFAPGDVGFTGRSTITGVYAQTGGTMSFDLGGTASSTLFQNPGSGFFDNLVVEGTGHGITLGGNLAINLVHGFETTIAPGNSFRIIDVLTTGSISGSFLNAASTFVHTQGGQNYNFGITYAGGTGNDVVLTLNSITPIPEPSAFAALSGLLGLGCAASRRRRRA